MRALVSDRPGHVELREIPVPELGRGELLIRVRTALTCGTDLKTIRRGHPKLPFPLVLGHEFSGVVERAGSGVAFDAGEPVVAAVSGPCGECPACRAGTGNLCASAFEEPLWGAFAEFVLVPARVVSLGVVERIPDGLDFAAAALLDPLASVLRGVGRIRGARRQDVLILGSGPIALLFTALLARERRVVVWGRRPGRLAAHGLLGAETIEADGGPLADAVGAGGAREAPGVVIDTTGDAGVISAALGVVARGGTLLLFAGLPGGAVLPIQASRIHYDEVTLAGSFHYTPAEAREALRLLAAGRIPTASLITATTPLSAYEAVFDSLARGEGMKTAFLP